MAHDDALNQARAAGDLAGWLAAAIEAVKARPADPQARLALAEALVWDGQLERADGHLDLVADHAPAWGPRAALLRQLLRAEQTRCDVMAGRAVPELLFEPDAAISAALARLVELARPDGAPIPSEAVPLLHVNDSPVPVAFRDLDDRLADVVELFSSTGKYFWLPASAIAQARFRPVSTPFEAIWRLCDLAVHDGPDGVVFWPTRYPAAPGQDAAEKLGRATRWSEQGGLSLGHGRRCFLVDDACIDSLALDSLAQAELAVP